MKKTKSLVLTALLCVALITCSFAFVGCKKKTETPTIANAEELNAAFAKGGSYVLADDITLSEVAVINGKDVVLDLGNHKITATASSAIRVQEKGTLVINGSGMVKGGSGGSYTAVTAMGADTKVTINGGEYTVGGDENQLGNSTIYARDGSSIFIMGGKFSSEKMYNEKYYVLNLKNNSNSTISVSGGTFVGQNPATGDDVDGGNFLAEGYAVTENPAGTYVVTKAPVSAS